MLTAEEKAYCRALTALRNKDFAAADTEFQACSSSFASSTGFKIIAEATRLLVQLQEEKAKLKKITLTIKEAASHGQETVVCGQGQQEETC